jgi:transposase-like protein
MAKDEKVESVTETVQHIRRERQRQHNAEEKIDIVLAGLHGESSISELCRREGVNPAKHKYLMRSATLISGAFCKPLPLKSRSSRLRTQRWFLRDWIYWND